VTMQQTSGLADRVRCQLIETGILGRVETGVGEPARAATRSTSGPIVMTLTSATTMVRPSTQTGLDL
jgi:hypothetical protein